MGISNLINMKCLDVFMSSLAPDKCKTIQSKLQKTPIAKHPLMGWDIVSEQRCLHDKVLEGRLSDISILKKLKRKFEWNISVPEVLATKYDALVLTDTSKIIQWVNDGFYSMTGYNADEAIGQSPRFLQGPATSPESQKTFKKGFASAEPFSGEVINYRKDGEIYACKLTIFPIRNADDLIVNYLALENEYVI
ncbi:MAG: PAS domain-containing protein [Bacteroidetes bacterium]|nr:MAG: PAS domain-containing protein [Bacteroidota bacterium]